MTEDSRGLEKSKVIDLVVALLIAGMGLFIAWVCFGILNSHADAKMHGYSLEGSIAGALVSVTLLSSVYLQFRKSSGDLEKLKQVIEETARRGEERVQELERHNHELEQKLIKGAPHPANFDIEVDERQRIVLAIPREWKPRGGILFDYLQEIIPERKDDVFPAAFTVSFVPIGKDTEERDTFYETFGNPDPGWFDGHTAEIIYLGGEPNSLKSVKLIAHQYAQVNTWKEPATGKVNRQWWYTPAPKGPSHSRPARTETSIAEASDETKPPVQASGAQAASANPGAPEFNLHPCRVCHVSVACYHNELGKVFFFDFVDDEEDFTTSSEKFNQVLSSTRFLT